MSPYAAAQTVNYDDPLVPQWHRSQEVFKLQELTTSASVPTLDPTRDVIAFVFDSGLDPVDFAPNLLPNPNGDFYGFSIFGGIAWANTTGHGNAVAWRLRFQFSNYLQMYGLDPSQYHLWIVPIQNGTDTTIDLSRMPECEQYALTVMQTFPGMRCAWNMSFGGGSYGSDEEMHIAEGYYRRSITVTGPRNQPVEDQAFPLAYSTRVPEVGVGASQTDANGGSHLASFSGFGPNVKVFAPGVLVQTGPASFGSGSSFAIPDVAAWFLASALARPSMTEWDLIQLLTVSAVKSAELDGKVFTGGGFFAPERAFSNQFLALLQPRAEIIVTTVKPAKIFGTISQDRSIYIIADPVAKVRLQDPDQGRYPFVGKRLAARPQWVSAPLGGNVTAVP